MDNAFWRIAPDTPDYLSDSLSGKGAEKTGGRWNRMGTPMVYCASSISLACLETLVHLSGDVRLPLNRYLVRIRIPSAIWSARAIFDAASNIGWDALPEGKVSLEWGTAWAQSLTSLVAEVPSVIVPEESNLLINSRHPQIERVTSQKIRKWTYDARLFAA